MPGQQLKQDEQIGDPIAEVAVVDGNNGQSAALDGTHAQADELSDLVEHLRFRHGYEVPAHHAPTFHQQF